MPRDLVGRVNWDIVEPQFAEALFNVLAACRRRGADYFVICGTRSFEEQQTLFDQGRTKPGPIVTKARPGESFHNFGLAVDVCRDGNIERSGLQPLYIPEAYRTFAEECLKAGLDSGFYWKKFRDCPHVQPKMPPGTLKKCRELYALGGGLGPVWAFVRSGT